MFRLFQLISYAVTITLVIIIWNAVTHPDNNTSSSDSSIQKTSINEAVDSNSLYDEIEALYDPESQVVKEPEPQKVITPEESSNAMVLDGDEHVQEKANRYFHHLPNDNRIKMSKRFDNQTSAHVVLEDDGLYHLTVCDVDHYYDCLSFSGTPIIDIAQGLLFSLENIN